MTVAAPLHHLIVKTKASTVYFKDVFKAKAAPTMRVSLPVLERGVYPWYWQSINKQCCVKGLLRHGPLSLSLCHITKRRPPFFYRAHRGDNNQPFLQTFHGTIAAAL